MTDAVPLIDQIVTKRLELAELNQRFEQNNAGVTSTQAIVLCTLMGRGRVTQKELIDLTGIDRSTLSEMLARLERKGLVNRTENKDDKRSRYAALTRKGRRAVEQIRQIT